MRYTPPSGPLPIGGVLDDAVQLYRATFRRSWVIAFAFSVATAVFSAVIFRSLPDYGTVSTASLQNMMAALSSPPVLAVDLIVTLLSLTAYGALTALESAAVQGDETLSIARACAAGFRRLPGLVLASLIFGVGVIVGLIVLVIPGIWLWGRWMLWIPAMFAANETALGSLASSWRLTSGNWWRGTAIVSVALTMMIVVAVVFTFVGGAVVGILRVDARDAPIIVQLASQLAHTLTYPFFVAALLSTYRDFKLRREGTDLAMRADALGSAES